MSYANTDLPRDFVNRTVGKVLPPEGVTFYAIPREFGVPPSYRYAVVNDEVVLVDPVTREIVDLVD
jgi:Protein of unknown function (DUF1236)